MQPALFASNEKEISHGRGLRQTRRWSLHQGAVGFIDWLGSGASSPIPPEKKLWNKREAQGTDDSSEANPIPPRRSKPQKPEPITKRSNRREDEKWPREAAVNAAASGSVEQTRYTHDQERC
jgi:hypothetical protein